ncbi:MAG: HDOD domain-containing protein [Candidatus Eisenbacteria bacterium]
MKTPRIVLLEDEPVVADPLRLLLEQEGYLVNVAPDPAAFLAAIHRDRFDLALLDVHLQDRLSGIDLGLWMKQRPRFADIPILILSNDSDRETIVHAMKNGAADYVLKADFDFAKLLDRIARLTRPAKTDAAPQPTEAPSVTEIPAGRAAPVVSETAPSRPRTQEVPPPTDSPPVPDPDRPDAASIQALQKALARLGDLRALPFVAQEVLELARSSSVGTRQLVQTISKDQALAAKVLRIANSVVYGSRGRVTDLNRAVVNVGTNGLQKLVLGMSVVDLFPDGEQKEGGLDRIAFWAHSLATAVIARRLAEAIHYPDPEEAFVAGLLHDLGKPMLEEVRPKDYARALDRVRRENIRLADAERRVFGMDHGQAARLVAERWKLPAPLVFVMSGATSSPPGKPRTRQEETLLAIVRAAGTLAKALGLGDSGDPWLSEPTAAALRFLRVQPEVADRMLSETEDEMNQLVTILWTHLDPDQGRKISLAPPAPPAGVNASVLFFGAPEAVALSPFRALCRRWGCDTAHPDPRTFPGNQGGNFLLTHVGSPAASSFPPTLRPYRESMLFVLPPGRSGAPVGAVRELPCPFDPKDALKWLRFSSARVTLIPSLRAPAAASA